MVICFTCDRRTKDILDQLVATGEYRDYGEVIAVAIGNLSQLQAQASGGDILLTATAPAPPVPARPQEPGGSAPQAADVLPAQTAKSAPGVPALFRVTPRPEGVAVATPPPATSESGPVLLDKWLFGQYNRLLPAKATCRALANMLCERPDGVDINELRKQTAGDASVLSQYLRKHEKRAGMHRDDAFSIALPDPADSTGRSQSRFADQFVGAIDRQGRLLGLPAALRLLGLVGGSKVALTEDGWQFVDADSPVLDGPLSKGDGRLSEEETSFLAGLIARAVPVEHFAYLAILRAVRDGHGTPTAMEAALAPLAPTSGDRSPGSMASQRSGAIARMADLGLLMRRRDGIRAKYELTRRGEEYLRLHGRTA